MWSRLNSLNEAWRKYRKKKIKIIQRFYFSFSILALHHWEFTFFFVFLFFSVSEFFLLMLTCRDISCSKARLRLSVGGAWQKKIKFCSLTPTSLNHNHHLLLLHLHSMKKQEISIGYFILLMQGLSLFRTNDFTALWREFQGCIRMLCLFKAGTQGSRVCRTL